MNKMVKDSNTVHMDIFHRMYDKGITFNLVKSFLSYEVMDLNAIQGRQRVPLSYHDTSHSWKKNEVQRTKWVELYRCKDDYTLKGDG